ncbi:MAG: WD40 repeat domain-containing protein, partial [Gemmataceae bacterium]|nr:WD40 repeat domain-containing protein [Gemmataceae bacterium]
MQLFSLDRLMAEALVDVQYMHRIKGDMRVTIEPSQETGEIWKFPNHVAPITAVAVTKDPKEPLIISASEDKTVCVWQRFSRQPLHEFVHAAPVRALAVTGRGAARNLLLTGCSDGSVRLYDLEAPEKKLVKELKDAHREAITALAFSPDGKFFASGAADGSIRIWDVEAGLGLYEFDSAHQGMITALAITPQARLVSAARDNSLRVWALKEKGAVPEIERSGRSGNVPQLGVSQDGRWMLFDHGKILQIRAVDDGKLVTTLQNPGGAIPFETLAVFSPDASLMLTAGAAQGRLQMWRAPNETERGYEIRQLVPPEGAAVTCAAFSPWAGLSSNASFAVSGTKEGLVYMWPVPTKEEVHTHPIRDVRVKVIQAGQDPSTRQVRIGVEVPNPVTALYPKGRLIPGRPVTIVIE